MTIVWSDGQQTTLTHSLLRGFCPCATCQGHQGPARFVAGGNTELADLAEVGNYALRLTWADGHSTGIYSFNFLKRLETAKPEDELER